MKAEREEEKKRDERTLQRFVASCSPPVVSWGDQDRSQKVEERENTPPPPLPPLSPVPSLARRTRLFSTLPYRLQMDGRVPASTPPPTTSILLLLLQHLASVPLQHPADFVTLRWERRTEGN